MNLSSFSTFLVFSTVVLLSWLVGLSFFLRVFFFSLSQSCFASRFSLFWLHSSSLCDHFNRSTNNSTSNFLLFSGSLSFRFFSKSFLMNLSVNHSPWNLTWVFLIPEVFIYLLID